MPWISTSAFRTRSRPTRPPVPDDSVGLAAGQGLDRAAEAVSADSGQPRGDVPSLPDLPDQSPGGDFAALVHSSGLAFLDTFAFGRGGTPGGNGGGGSGGGGGGGSGGGETLLSSYRSGSDTPGGFNIDIKFGAGDWTASLQDSFVKASELISDIIIGDIQDIFYRGKVIDDISIEAKLSAIDGVGNVLGQAGPTAYRTTDFLPAMAIMEFDVADAENYDGQNLFNDIVFHEMMHCVGFGTMWDLMGLVTDASTDGSDLRFTGENATLEYLASFDTSGDPTAADGVPVESDFGAGTRGGHWNDGAFEPDGSPDDDQAGFGNEIMTGFINGSGNYLSDVTIAALQDMGYETIYAPDKDVTLALDLGIFTNSMVIG